MKHIVIVEIDTEDRHRANIIRDEIVGAIEDFTESYRPGFSVSAGELEEIETDRHAALIELATELHGSDEIESDGNARLSEGADGIWVQGWLFISNEDLKARGIENPEAPEEEPEPEPVETVDSEGGHCD